MEQTVDGELLELLIRKKYKTQSAFAEAVGVSRQYISQIIKGERTPSLPRIVEFAQALDVSVDELLGKEVALAGVLV